MFKLFFVLENINLYKLPHTFSFKIVVQKADKRNGRKKRKKKRKKRELKNRFIKHPGQIFKLIIRYLTHRRLI